MKRNKSIILTIFFASLTFSGCLKDNVTSVQFKLNDNALLLTYLENEGDYINSNEMPSIVNTDEVYNQLNNYLIIDVRSREDYITGHITGAINIRNDYLLSYLDSSKNNADYSKIILVSSTGQAAAYYTCLLRLYGINNIYSLIFGMAEWNRAFSGVWLNNIKNSKILNFFVPGITYLPDPKKSLPSINFKKQNGPLEDKIKSRISALLKQGFKNDTTYVSVDPPDELKFNNKEIDGTNYIVCYGQIALYYVYGKISHFPYSYPYLIGNDLKSTKYLQTLPPDKKIVVYSVSGQISAFVVAYLRLLGYDAKSLMFGANGLFYSTLENNQLVFSPFVFLSNDIRNYPYVTGPSQTKMF